MNAVIHPGLLRGGVRVPPSKSAAHRALIASALADAPTEIEISALNEDILATIGCLRALGAKIEQTDEGLRVSPIERASRAEAAGENGIRASSDGESVCAESAGEDELRVLNCGESGSTLRFMLPVAAALGAACVFTGGGRLPERPNRILTDALNAHGAYADRELLPIRLSGRLTGGMYAVAGNVSSQYITGLLLALPLCAQDSEIVLTKALESASYVGITLETLAAFGVRVLKTQQGWHVPGGQRYRSPGRVRVEGDWSAAAFWLAANALGSRVECEGLNADSAQGDRAIARMLNELGGEIDVSDTPDLVPALAVAAAAHPGQTHITGAARLRVKESDRLRAVADLLRALGGRVEELSDGLIIDGGHPFTGGTVNGANDHRIVMAAAIAATAARGDVIITDAQAVAKSYPGFFEQLRRLDGRCEVGCNETTPMAGREGKCQI